MITENERQENLKRTRELGLDARCTAHGKRLIGTEKDHGHCGMCCIEENPNWRTEGFACRNAK